MISLAASGLRARRLMVLVAVLLAAATSTARATRGLTTGFNADPVLTGPSAASNPFWIEQARAEAAGMVRVNVAWSAVAPSPRPADFSAADPGSPGYDWSQVDAEVRELADHGLQVLINISSAPAWAEGPGRPAGVHSGTWKPQPAQFAQFAAAAARRYDGRFPDPAHSGAALPRVRYWQAWNEPNLDTYLSPQWEHTRSGFVPASPGIYRPMLEAFYQAIKRVSPTNLVISAGMAPYGNAPGVNFPGGYRMPPLTFDRQLLSRPVHLDALAQNTYPIHGPLWHAYQPNDVAVADLYKVQAVLRAAAAAERILPHGPKQLWVTELGWTSRPNPGGIPVAQQARWYEQAFYALWRQGVDTVLLLQIVDAPPVPDYAASYQTGLYYVTGRPKPAAIAFRFPFVAERRGRATIAWGRAPVAGRLHIESRLAGHWVNVGTLSVSAGEVFEKALRLQGSATLRAQVDGQTSLIWAT
jgi:hypothetical protein